MSALFSMSDVLGRFLLPYCWPHERRVVRLMCRAAHRALCPDTRVRVYRQPKQRQLCDLEARAGAGGWWGRNATTLVIREADDDTIDRLARVLPRVTAVRLASHAMAKLLHATMRAWPSGQLKLVCNGWGEPAVQKALPPGESALVALGVPAGDADHVAALWPGTAFPHCTRIVYRTADDAVPHPASLAGLAHLKARFPAVRHVTLAGQVNWATEDWLAGVAAVVGRLDFALHVSGTWLNPVPPGRTPRDDCGDDDDTRPADADADARGSDGRWPLDMDVRGVDGVAALLRTGGGVVPRAFRVRTVATTSVIGVNRLLQLLGPVRDTLEWLCVRVTAVMVMPLPAGTSIPVFARLTGLRISLDPATSATRGAILTALKKGVLNGTGLRERFPALTEFTFQFNVRDAQQRRDEPRVRAMCDWLRAEFGIAATVKVLGC